MSCQTCQGKGWVIVPVPRGAQKIECEDCRGTGARLPYSFCLRPQECAGLNSCPRRLSCSE